MWRYTVYVVINWSKWKKRTGWVIPDTNLPKIYKYIKMVKKRKWWQGFTWLTYRFTKSIWPERQKNWEQVGGSEDKGVCPPMLICPQRVMGGQRKSGGGCRDVFECAWVLSNVNLTKEKEREGRGEVSDGHVWMLEKWSPMIMWAARGGRRRIRIHVCVL